MKNLTRTKIAYYTIVFIIILAFMLQDTLEKIKLTLVLEIYTKVCLIWRPLWLNTSFETVTMINFKSTLDAVMSRVPTFSWPIAHIGQPIFHFGKPTSKTPKTLNTSVGILSSLTQREKKMYLHFIISVSVRNRVTEC